MITISNDKSFYVKERLDDQIEWYDKKSMDNQKKYTLLKITQIICASLIPALAPFAIISNAIIFTAITSLLGFLIVVSESISSFKKYHDNYIQYRTTCEALKHEKYLYQNNVADYADECEPHDLLVLRVESIISHENINWATMRKDAKQEEQKC